GPVLAGAPPQLLGEEPSPVGRRERLVDAALFLGPVRHGAVSSGRPRRRRPPASPAPRCPRGRGSWPGAGRSVVRGRSRPRRGRAGRGAGRRRGGTRWSRTSSTRAP